KTGISQYQKSEDLNAPKIKEISEAHHDKILNRLNDIFGIDAFYSMRQHILPGMLQGTIEINALAGIGNDIGLKAQFAGIDGGPSHTEVSSNPNHKYRINTTFTQITGQTGCGFLICFHKGGITVNPGIKTLADNQLRLR